MRGKKLDHRKIESKWQKKWFEGKLYTPDLKKAKRPFYNLMMFPYPSAEGLHAGNMFAFTGSDVYGRFKRMSGFDVFEPIGLDGFGIHSENYALKVGKSPQEHAAASEKKYYQQLRQIGNAFDWTKTLETYDPGYYRWTQWFFIQLFKAGLAYREKSSVNWCPSCKTVLADEQVIAGKCERCGTEVTSKELKQWFFRITNYAERLLKNLDKIDWSQRVVTAQKNWIGKSEGMMIRFKTSQNSSLEVFTTRPDTLNAVTFLATSKLYDPSFTKDAQDKEKLGKFTGKYAIDPLSGRKLPIWDTNYVSPDYGTGVIMGVPAHDERDMEFAKKYDIDIVNKKPDQALWDKIEKEEWGEKHTSYHLRDWLVSRQRYWGAPIPMVECPKDGWVPIPEEELPVLLPDIKDYKPEGTGRGPLANHKNFYETTCPKCGGKAKRETDVMDTFVDSSWYFLRYPSVGLAVSAPSLPWDQEITKRWLPVDLYFGGAEHSVLHLMYSRFITMVYHDLGYLDFDEPFPRFFAHGLMIKDGAKMSKSRGNIVNPDEYIEKFGADTLRLYLMFMGPMDGYPDFRDTGIEGMRRFVERVWELVSSKQEVFLSEKDEQEITIKMHQTIKKVTEDIEHFRYNTAISAIMEFVNLLRDLAASSHTSSTFAGPADAPTRSASSAANRPSNWQEALRTLCLLLAPFAPHITEEMWTQQLKRDFSVHTHPWPKYDSELVKEEFVTIAVQVNGKLRATLKVKSQKSKLKSEIEKAASEDPKVKKWLTQGKYKTIFVPGRLINFVLD